MAGPTITKAAPKRTTTPKATSKKITAKHNTAKKQIRSTPTDKNDVKLAGKSESNPYSKFAPSASKVKVDAWGKGKNSSLDSILKSQGYSDKEIYGKGEDGKSLLDKVSATNKLKNPNLILPGQELTVPKKGEVAKEAAKQDAAVAEKKNDAAATDKQGEATKTQVKKEAGANAEKTAEKKSAEKKSADKTTSAKDAQLEKDKQWWRDRGNELEAVSIMAGDAWNDNVAKPFDNNVTKPLMKFGNEVGNRIEAADIMIRDNITNPANKWLNTNVTKPVSGFVTDVDNKLKAADALAREAISDNIGKPVSRWVDTNIAKPIDSAGEAINDAGAAVAKTWNSNVASVHNWFSSSVSEPLSSSWNESLRKARAND